MGPFLSESYTIIFMDQIKPWVEWGAVVFNIGYVILAARQDRRCWPVGIVGLALSFLVYMAYRFYSDATLQVFYLGLSLYGWAHWARVEEDSGKGYYRMDGRLWIGVLAVGSLTGLALGHFWKGFGAAVPYGDGLTTTFSILCTWLTARRYLENWLLWILIDLGCVYLYILKGLNVFAGLFLVYAGLAVWGYLRWKRQFQPMDPR